MWLRILNYDIVTPSSSRSKCSDQFEESYDIDRISIPYIAK
jgi:hypothetical protein